MVNSRDVLALWPKKGTEEEADPVEQVIVPSPRRVVGGPKIIPVIEALQEMFERKPTSKNRVYLLAKLREKLGHNVSESTLDRAWDKAWK